MGQWRQSCAGQTLELGLYNKLSVSTTTKATSHWELWRSKLLLMLLLSKKAGGAQRLRQLWIYQAVLLKVTLKTAL